MEGTGQPGLHPNATCNAASYEIWAAMCLSEPRFPHLESDWKKQPLAFQGGRQERMTRWTEWPNSDAELQLGVTCCPPVSAPPPSLLYIPFPAFLFLSCLTFLSILFSHIHRTAAQGAGERKSRRQSCLLPRALSGLGLTIALQAQLCRCVGSWVLVHPGRSSELAPSMWPP